MSNPTPSPTPTPTIPQHRRPPNADTVTDATLDTQTTATAATPLHTDTPTPTRQHRQTPTNSDRHGYRDRHSYSGRHSYKRRLRRLRRARNSDRTATATATAATATATRPPRLPQQRLRRRLPPCATPAAPTGLVATPFSSTQINLTWTDNATNETGYRVQRSPNGVNSWVFIGGTLPANTVSYSDTGRTPGTTYYYRVGAFNACGNSASSNVASATTPPTGSPTPTPTPTAATLRLPPTATATATATAPHGYNAQRRHSYRDSDRYSYYHHGDCHATPPSRQPRLRQRPQPQLRRRRPPRLPQQRRHSCADATATVTPSATPTATPCSTPATATNLVATPLSSTQIKLTWTDNATNETNYRVQRSLDGINFAFIPGTLPANSVMFTDTGRTPNTTYYYRVGSFNGCGFSPNSNMASATTPP